MRIAFRPHIEEIHAGDFHLEIEVFIRIRTLEFAAGEHPVLKRTIKCPDIRRLVDFQF